FLLDRPQQAACLVEVDVVGPTVERCETLLSTACAATSVTDAISTGTMPRHADEKRAVVTEVGRPPVLRISHELAQVGFQCLVIELLEFLCIVECAAERVGLG